MRQTLALMIDAYRELNARKMFWITLILSGLVVGIFAMIGINENGIKILWWQLPTQDMGLTSNVVPPDLLYKTMFVEFGIGIWLAWIATILALVSTASIIPDLISSGTIDLVLSKPISRLRLFLTKYLGGLLFVTLQVSIFAIVSFLVIGVRGGVWEPGLLISIPIVVIFFSYLFAICVLLGLITKSTIAALLLTMLAWFCLFIVNTADGFMVMLKSQNESRIASLERGVEITLDSIERNREQNPDRIPDLEERLEGTRERLADAQDNGGTIRTIYNIIYGFKTVMPKTSETIGLLERSLIDMAELPGVPEDDQPPPPMFAGDESERRGARDEQLERGMMEEFRSRSVWWVMGTSLIFEFFVLVIASWIFIRRDF